MSDCNCDFAKECDGTGVLECEGCTDAGCNCDCTGRRTCTGCGNCGDDNGDHNEPEAA